MIQPCTLKTVIAYASTAGNRTIELRNSSNAIITSTVINMAVGANTLNLNFALNVGTGYRLGLNSASAVNLFRTSAGGPAYPTNIGGLVDFTGTSAATAGYYYFYYNWQLQKNACTSTPIAVTASIGTGPTLTVNSPTVCSGQSTNLTAGGATTYSWSSGQTTSSIAVTPTASASYTVYGTTSSCTSSLVSSISVNPNPTVTVNSATVCSGQSTNLIATGATTYSWSSGQSTSSIAVTPTATTSYSVTGYSGACSNTQVSNITVNPNPTVTVNSPGICTGQTATITANGASSYTFNPGAITGNPIAVSPTTTTTYTVTGANGNCIGSAISTISVSLCTGVQEIPSVLPNVISVYPNPAENYIEVLNTVTTDKVRINLYDVTGKLITTKETIYYKEIIDISKYARGLYFVEIMNGDNRIYRTKIIKQ